MRIATVKVKDGNDGFYIINESDFNDDIHELFEKQNDLKQHSVDWYKKELDLIKVEYLPTDKKADLKVLYDNSI